MDNGNPLFPIAFDDGLHICAIYNRILLHEGEGRPKVRVSHKRTVPFKNEEAII